MTTDTKKEGPDQISLRTVAPGETVESFHATHVWIQYITEQDQWG